MKPYSRKVNYYETDQMGVVHHSNFIRWFEEARVYMMDCYKFGYHELEAIGITSPVLEVKCSYKSMVRFGETIVVDARIASFTGAKLTVDYTITDEATGILRAQGETSHSFWDKENARPVSLKRYPEAYEVFVTMMDDGNDL